MKKIKIFCFIFLIISVFAFYGCTNLSENIQDKLSEVRFNLFSCQNEYINIKFTSGFREDPYILNGKSENKKEFGIITVKFFIETSNKNSLPSFVITINGMDFDGEFELNPFDQTYVQDIETFVLDESEIQIKVTWQDFVYESEMENFSNKFNYTHKDALNIFTKEYRKKIVDYLKNNIEFEVYVKILNDPSINIDINYFYVCLITNTGESLSVIIDPNSGKILAKNENDNQTIL